MARWERKIELQSTETKLEEIWFESTTEDGSLEERENDDEISFTW